MKVWHSVGDVVVLGTIVFMRGYSLLRRSSINCDLWMRGSLSCVADSGGGHGPRASQLRIERTAGSSARRQDSAVEPVRGRPKPISATPISCSPIPASSRYHYSPYRQLPTTHTTSLLTPARP